MFNRVASLRYIFLSIAINYHWTAGQVTIPKCTSQVCADYIEDTGCPDVSDCKGILLPSPTICNCCHYCLEYLEEGSQCSQGTPGQPSVQKICGPQLSCSKDNICEKMQSKCMNEKTAYEEKWKNGQLGGGEIEPFCDDHGDYGHLQCIPGSVCYCSSPTGERIFGEMINQHADIKLRMDCACSIGQWRAFKRFDRMEKKTSKRHRMKSLFARCLPNGSYDILQCINNRCACVDEKGSPQLEHLGNKLLYVSESDLKDGNPWCFNLTRYEKGSFDTPCLKEREKSLNRTIELEAGVKNGVRSMSPAAVIGEEYYIPECAPDGSYEKVQKTWDKVSCVDPDGNILEGDTGLYSIPNNSTAAKEMDCYCARTVYLFKKWAQGDSREVRDSMYNESDYASSLIFNIPVCCPNGNFAKWQCYKEECHCVDNYGAETSPNVPQDLVGTLSCYNGGKACTSIEE